MPAASESGWWRLGFDLPDFVGVRLQRHVPTVLDSMAHHRMLCSDSRDGGIDVIHSEGVTTWDDETDVIVAGSGGGLVGAYTAAREGLSVMVVEATDQFGGTTAYSGGGGMWFPCNPVLQRAGSDDTLDAAFAYFHAAVGDRTPVELQRTYVYGGSDLIAYLEQDAHFEFDALPWPAYYGRLPHARLDGLRHTVSKPLPAERLGELAQRIRGPLDRERLGAQTPKCLVGGRALIGRLLSAITAYPHVSLHLNSPLVELVTSNDGVVGAVVEQHGRRCAIRTRVGALLAAGGFENSPALRAGASACPAMPRTRWARRATSDWRSRQEWPQARRST